MSLKRERPKAEYNCAQDEFYRVCLLGWDSYLNNVNSFGAFNTTYTATLGNTRRAEVLNAQALPDFQARDEQKETAGILLDQKADDCLIKWKALESHIKKSFPKNLHKPKIESAGSDYYHTAANDNWESVSAIMSSARNFIAENTAVLATGGMPSNFPLDFSNLKSEFNDLHGIFQTAKQNAEEQRDEKINANNECFKALSDMFEDGQKIFRYEAAKRERFTFTKILHHVSGSGANIRTLSVSPQSVESVKNARAGSAITNIGTVMFFIFPGIIPLPVDHATPILPGETVPNTFGREITFSNPDAITTARLTLSILES